MADKKYPVLYATSIKGTIFRHCGVYNTIYFNIYNNKELEDKPYYLEYMEKTREEVYKAIQNKFTMSQPLKVTNDHKVFIIFRDWSCSKFFESFKSWRKVDTNRYS